MKLLLIGILAVLLTGCTVKTADVWIIEQSRIEVYKKIQGKQCEDNSGLIERIKQELLDQKISVSAKRLQGDGMMYVQMCGAPKEQLAVFTIAADDLPRATALGFKPFTY